jgi:hypothetical protein
VRNASTKAYLAARPDIWLTTSDDVAAHYLVG